MGIVDKFKGWFKGIGNESLPQNSEAPASTSAPVTSQPQPSREPVAPAERGSQHQPQPEASTSKPAPVAEKQTTKAPATTAAAAGGAAAPSASMDQQPTEKAQAASTSKPVPADIIQTFFADAVGEANRYSIREVIGKGSYGIVCSAVDNFTGEKVAIKKINNVFEHVSDATRILREIKLLRMLKHPDIVDIKHIMLPPNPRDFKDIYVVFELMETDLHQVIKANDDLTPEHHQFFLYQMLRGLKYIHSAKVFHRDIKPKNILANSDCKLKICDFGLARPAFNDAPTTIFWTDYVATRWYRAPELCGSFFAKYSPAIDVWSVGCIFAEVLLGRPLFPGRNVVHQLEIITDLLGTPSAEVIAKVRNEKARRFLSSMRKKPGVPFEQHFPNADPSALKLLKRLLAFDPSERPSAEEALADPYFEGLHSVSREPVAQPVSRLVFEFDRRKVTMEEVRDLIYREILEYHPNALREYLSGHKHSTFNNPSALDNFKRQFMHLEANPGAVLEPQQKGARPAGIQPATSLPREWMHEMHAAADEAIAAGAFPAARRSSVSNATSNTSSSTASNSTSAFAGKSAAASAAAAIAAGGPHGGGPIGIPPAGPVQQTVGRYLTSQVSAPMPRAGAGSTSSRAAEMSAAAASAVAAVAAETAATTATCAAEAAAVERDSAGKAAGAAGAAVPTEVARRAVGAASNLYRSESKS